MIDTNHVSHNNLIQTADLSNDSISETKKIDYEIEILNTLNPE